MMNCTGFTHLFSRATPTPPTETRRIAVRRRACIFVVIYKLDLSFAAARRRRFHIGKSDHLPARWAGAERVAETRVFADIEAAFGKQRGDRGARARDALG